ncbi:MAG: sugar ABC transporter permease, partial [Eubacteriales bacterium]|nr:sugar ABC transporter permease [Eubacteriales bacterium]
QNLALTNGRPYNGAIHTTEMLALNIVNSNTLKTKGVGQAKAVMFFVLVAIIGIFQMKATHDKEVQQ